MQIRVKVKTGSKKQELVFVSKDKLEVSLKEKPERNEANKKLVSVIGKQFHVPTEKVKILTGHRKPSKTLLIDTSK